MSELVVKSVITIFAVFVAVTLLVGCSRRNPEWAGAVNPCCGQDLVLLGIEPPEDRCADIVLDQETARRLMASLASGSGGTQWHVRFIPGGPACIWEQWPGLTDDDFMHVDPPEEVRKEQLEAAGSDTGALAPRVHDE
jgi:hypothetical protein